MMSFVEIEFQLRGVSIGTDHPTCLLSQIEAKVLSNSECCTAFAGQASHVFDDIFSYISISRIVGCPDFRGQILLTEQSNLRIRLPEWLLLSATKILNEAIFDLNSHRIRLVEPKLRILTGNVVLCSRIVTFDPNINRQSEFDRFPPLAPSEFEKLLRSSLRKMDILDCTPSIEINDRDNYALRSIGIDGHQHSGYGVRIEGLSEQDSLKLQSFGIGEGKHFGCGWFIPEHGFNY